jgi:hypothetical protein
MRTADFHIQDGPPKYSSLITCVAKAKEYLERHPYCIPSYIQVAQIYRRLGYPDLTAGALYKALLLSDAVRDESDEYHKAATESLTEWIASMSPSDGQRILGPECNELAQTSPRMAVVPLVLNKLLPQLLVYRKCAVPSGQSLSEVIRANTNRYLDLILALWSCGCYKSASGYYAQASVLYPNNADLRMAHNRVREAVAKHFDVASKDLQESEYNDSTRWPDNGFVRREIYPWNEHEPDRLKEIAVLNEMMTEVAPKLEVKVVELPVLSSKPGSCESTVVQQLGVFAREDLAPEEIILDETSILTANNKLQDALCDACNADLPTLDSEDAKNTIACPDCEVVFCSQRCSDAASQAYHPALCGKDVESIAKDTSPDEAAESLYSLLLLRSLAMAQTQDCHPLNLKEVKYIWGDFNDVAIANENVYAEGRILFHDFRKTLPFSFDYNIRLPFHMLEKMDIDIFANPQYDVWVFNTLYAKFRGTASARLSGSEGGPIRGPEVGAVHPMWCLANHSCDPNVSWEWDASIKFWVRDLRQTWERDNENERSSENTRWSAAGIKKGEEVLNHYCDIDLLVNERRAWMRGCLGGDCRCPRCVWEAKETG